MGFKLKLENVSLFSSHHNIFNDLNLIVDNGEKIGIVGSSGIGKTSLAWLALGMLPKGLFHKGYVYLDDNNIYSNDLWISQRRGKEISYLGQFSESSLSPIKKIENHIKDIISLAELDNNRVVKLIEKLKLDVGLMDRYPHQLSGGQLQRVNVLLSLLHQPKLLILDEVTSSQDNETANLILQVIKDEVNENNSTLLVISHDIAPIQMLCSRVVRLSDHSLTFDGSVEDFIESMSSQGEKKIESSSSGKIVMRLENIQFYYKPTQILCKNVNLYLYESEIIGIFGDSGSGKSSLAKIIANRLLPKSGELIAIGKKTFYVDQEVLTAFNPKHKMVFAIKELVHFNKISESDVNSHLKTLDLDMSLLNSYPHELSGGQLQRFMFLLALISKPDVLVLDETFSALDTENQLSALNLLFTLVEKQGWSVILISHNLPLLNMACSKIFQLSNGDLIQIF